MTLKYKKLWLGILFTVACLFFYRLGYFIQLPYISYDNVKSVYSSGSMFGFLDIFSGGALSNFSIVALGVSPYITASIVVQLLQMDIIPVLKEWSEEGETGKQKLLSGRGRVRTAQKKKSPSALYHQGPGHPRFPGLKGLHGQLATLRACFSLPGAC